MRIRSRYGYPNVELQNAIDSNGNRIYTPGNEYSSSNCPNAEYIKDVVGNRFNWNPVSHVKMSTVYGTPSQFVRENPFGDPYVITYIGAFGGHTNMQEGPYQVTMAGSLTGNDTCSGWLPAGEAGGFTRQAFNRVLDQIPESVSIANFLLELKDLRNLLPRLNGWQTWSDLFLTWQFGVSPLMRDIRSMLRLMADVRLRLEHLKKINHRTVTISHNRKFVLVDTDSKPPPPNAGPSFPAHPNGNPWVRYHEVVARINIRASYDLNLGGADDLLQAACSALGLMNPAKIVWNAIPFSFVVDWFVNIGNFLDLAEVQPFTGTIKILGSDTSFKTKMFVDYYNPAREYQDILGFTHVDEEPYCTTLYRGFFRRSGTPDGSIVSDGLTPLQQALAIALITSGAGPRGRVKRKKLR